MSDLTDTDTGLDVDREVQDVAAVQRLIDAGADLDEQDRMGHTPLHVAAGSEEPGSGGWEEEESDLIDHCKNDLMVKVGEHTAKAC